MVVAGLLIGILMSVGAHADSLDDAKALMKEATDLVINMQNSDPPPDAEQMNQVHAESIALLREACTVLERDGVRTTDRAEMAFTYGDLLVRLGDIDLAVIALRNASKLAPEKVNYALAHGTIAVGLGEGFEDEATKALHAVIEMDPESQSAADAHAQLADVYRRSGLYDLTLESVEAALTISPDHARAQFLKAVCLARLGRFLEANTLMDAVAVSAPSLAGDSHSWLYDAVLDFERRNLWVADTAEEHAAYGKMLIRVNRLPDSMNSLRHAVRLNPGDAVVWNLLGSVYRQANLIDSARDAFERSLAIDPDQERTRQVLEQLKTATPTP
jgi:tetratricopeptide (TPR) repeat protein